MTKYYYDIAIDVPLYHLFTYQSELDIPVGKRVIVSFRKKLKMGIVLNKSDSPPTSIKKIMGIHDVIDDCLILNQEWIHFIEFTAKYYIYPIGQTVFNVLPKIMKEHKIIDFGTQEFAFSLSLQGNTQTGPSKNHHLLSQLWNTLKDSTITSEEAIFIHPNAKKYLRQWTEKRWISAVKTKKDFIFNSKKLTIEQENVKNNISKKIFQFQTILLFGITGSGKTELYFEMMAKIIKEHKQVLFLLPEINLTPQFFSRIKISFPNTNLVLLHSKLSASKRNENYIAAAMGDAQIILGTRLSVFTPLKNLGLIIVDEEHDDSYKQENELRYHARDLAVYRAKINNCPIILGSATPSLESWNNALNGKYQLEKLTQRAVSNAFLPEVKLIDTRKKILKYGLSEEVIEALTDNLHHQKLSLIYINRRGFSLTVFCQDCGFIFNCPHCSSKLVYHKNNNKLVCHHCEYQINPPTSCPDCGNQDLTLLGQGAEKIEDVLQNMFPTARIARVDSDTTKNKNNWTKIRENILDNQLDMLVGTQILSKGHDFKKINLIIILNADSNIYSSDYRASEKLFSQLIQVSGRAGRSHEKGTVLIQTKFPEQEIFQDIKNFTFENFANRELAQRKLFNFPPYLYRIAIRASDLSYQTSENFLNQIKSYISSDLSIQVIGPFPQLVTKLAGRERCMLFIESQSRQKSHQLILNILPKIQKLKSSYRHLRCSIDVNPLEM